MMYRIFILGALWSLMGCTEKSFLSETEFRNLMTNVADGWTRQDTRLALSSFHEDAIYMEPPDIQYYRGHEQLQPYFDALTSEYQMEFHHLWFDEHSQTGAGEYTFSYGKNTADVGVVVVELSAGKIKFWREYQRKGPRNFKDFLDLEKEWQWHIGNYPVEEEINH